MLKPGVSPEKRLLALWLLLAFSLAAALYAGLAGISYGFRFDLKCNFRDFPNYYYAVKAYEAGFSPMDVGAIRALSKNVLFWVYPPPLVFPFAPLTSVDVKTAALIFTAVKIAVFALAMLGWLRCFPELRDDLHFAGFAALGMNLTLYHDLCGGNVAMLEAAAIAWALYCLLRGKLFGFFALIALASVWKLVPLGLALLAPALYPRRPRAWFGVAILAALTAALLLMWSRLDPEEFTRWLTIVRHVETIRINYFEGLKAVLWLDPNLANLSRWYQRPEVFAAVIVVGIIVLVTVVAWKRSLKDDAPAVRSWRLLLGGTLFTALLPGAFLYSYIFALPLVYLPLRAGLMRPAPFWPLALFGFALALSPTIPWRFLAGDALAIYQPVFAATVAWVLVLMLRPVLSAAGPDRLVSAAAGNEELQFGRT